MIPLLKWVGGKRRLAAEIASMLPARPKVYYEPFCGMGAVFCQMWNEGRIKRAVLGDANKAVTDFLTKVRDDPVDLLCGLYVLKQSYDEDGEGTYYGVRHLWNQGDRRPSFFALLCQAAFNGLWRESTAGNMNAPWGKYGSDSRGTPQAFNLYDEENILAWNRALADTEIRHETFEDSPVDADCVYADPPYLGDHTKYHAGGFEEHQQRALIYGLSDFPFAALSNSQAAEPLVREIWPEAQVTFLGRQDNMAGGLKGRRMRLEILARTPP